MSTITLIGLDGAGKTTIAKLLMESSARPMKYLYMGTAIGSSNYALLTSRLLHYLRKRRSRTLPFEDQQTLRPLEKRNTRGRIGAAFGLLHRLSEEWFRQLVSWIFQLRGFVLLYDRHFIFQCAPNDVVDQEHRRLSDRIHFWLLCHVYPRPQLVFFLDAPPEVLFERKPEATLEYLAVGRRTYLNLGKQIPNFIRIDATQPLDEVVVEIQTHIDRIHGNEVERRDTDKMPGSKWN
jgi:thymidylate kinase